MYASIVGRGVVKSGMDSQAKVAELLALGQERPGRLRLVLVARLRATGGSVDVAAQRLGIGRDEFVMLLRIAGATDAPARTRAETTVDLPRSSKFDRWFRQAG